jgi:hypothetical protein
LLSFPKGICVSSRFASLHPEGNSSNYNSSTSSRPERRSPSSPARPHLTPRGASEAKWRAPVFAVPCFTPQAARIISRPTAHKPASSHSKRYTFTFRKEPPPFLPNPLPAATRVPGVRG